MAWACAPADFRYDDFAKTEITRLEEARMAAIETRIDADLGAGTRGRARPGAASAYPGTSTARATARTAHARSLSSWAAGRGARRLPGGTPRLVEELGIEPTGALQELERAILAHDESIGGPRRRLLLPRVRQRRAVLIGLGGFLIVAAAATALAISLTRPGGGGISAVVQGNSLRLSIRQPGGSSRRFRSARRPPNWPLAAAPSGS